MGEDSCGAAKLEPERTSLSSPEDNQDPKVLEPKLAPDKVDLEEEAQLELLEQLRTQASICPQKMSQICLRSGEKKISPTIEALDKDLCRKEIEEALRGCCKQKQIPHPAKLEEEAEAVAEELRDVEVVPRNTKLFAQLEREKSPEDFHNVEGTCLVEIKESRKQPQLQKIWSHP